MAVTVFSLAEGVLWFNLIECNKEFIINIPGIIKDGDNNKFYLEGSFFV